jgi:hypothetical protein
MMGSDEMQDSKGVLECGDVKYTGQTHAIKRLVKWLHDYQANTLGVDDGIVCNAYGDDVWLKGLEPLTLGAHMRCSTQVCNPVLMSVALSLLNLEGSLHSAVVKVLCAHEGQHKD